MKISVIIPIYNAEKYLHKCLNSICNQTLKDLEIILIDDASTDNSLNIINEYKNKDSRIKVVNNIHVSEGAASARNAGLVIAKGEYLSFLDADDYFELDMFEKTYTKAINTNADIVLFDGIMFQNKTGELIETNNILNYSKLPKKDIFSYKDYPDYIFTSTTSAAWSKLFNRNFILKYSLKFQPIYYTDDILFTWGALALAKNITCVPKKFVFYRIGHNNAQTKKRTAYPLSVAISCLSLKIFLKEKGLFENLKNGYANSVIKRCAWNLNTLSTLESFKKLYYALSNEYMELLELETSLTKNILHFDAFEWINMIKKNDILAYGFCSDDYRSDKLFFKFSTINRFPVGKFNEHDKVVLYGSDKIGKALYIQNLLNQYCEIIAWVDESTKNSELKPPIISFDELSSRSFNKILISVQNDKLLQEVIDKFIVNYPKLTIDNIIIYTKS